jgi:hypothetical protein
MEMGALYQTIGRGIALIRAAGAAFTQTTRGLAAVVTRTSAGLYVVTLGVGTPAALAVCRVNVYGANPPAAATACYGNVTHTSDTVKTISTWVNTAGVSTATDVDFDFVIETLDA